LGGKFYAFASKELDPNYGFGPILDYFIPLKNNTNLRFYGSYAFDLAHICLSCDESLPRSFAYNFGILLDMDFERNN
jgi:hypothetical protein